MEYNKVVVGSHVKGNYTRLWLAGSQKEIVQQLKDKGFDVITKRPKAEAKPKAAKAPKAKKAKKAAAKKELVAA